MRIGLIGLGMVSGTYVDAIRNLAECEITRVYARSATARQAFVAQHPGVVACASVTEVLSDIDFVIVATPPDARTEIIEACIAAHVPVLMEKPMERTTAAAQKIVEACEAAGLPLGLMLQHRARPIVADLRARIGDLGPIQMVECNVPWWRPQSYYDAPGRGTYARDGGGVMINQAIHTFDLMLSLAGPVTAVTAMCATTGLHRMEAEDFVTAGLRFASGAVGQVFATTAQFPGRGETITLHGTLGSAHLDAGTLTLSWRDGRTEGLGQSAASGAGADPMAFTSDWHRTVIADFADAVAHGRAPMIPGRSALPVHHLITSIEDSAQKGRTVEVPHAP